jgi:hypothetical protein
MVVPLLIDLIGSCNFQLTYSALFSCVVIAAAGISIWLLFSANINIICMCVCVDGEGREGIQAS